jgi:hypothetical protein
VIVSDETGPRFIVTSLPAAAIAGRVVLRKTSGKVS